MRYIHMWKIPLKFSAHTFVSSQWAKGRASRSEGISSGSVIIVQCSKYSKPESSLSLRGPTQREVAGQSPLGSRRA